MEIHGETVAEAALRDLHRYFPEWADRPPGPDAQHESDRNSYLAGGYADEFGYGAGGGRPPAIPALAGDPEGGKLWREQIGGLHPGYPECPKPLDRAAIGQASSPSGARHGPLAPLPAAGKGRIIPVRPRLRGPLGRTALRVGVISFIAERLIRARHLGL